jgi:CubicO group peptidase (beta-lactamase class C family)
MPVPELADFDQLMQDFMNDNDIEAGLLCIMRNGVIVYQRGFGWKDRAHTIKMPENALVRVASAGTKPATAAAIRKLVANGQLSLSTPIFELGQGGGIIDPDPDPGQFLGDPKLKNINVQHCLSHTAGWDLRGMNHDYAQRPCDTVNDMGGDSPPGIDKNIAWGLRQPLQFEPGKPPPPSKYKYSNFGYLVLGKAVEVVSGDKDLISYMRTHVLTQDMWVPATDLLDGHSLKVHQPTREAWYDDDEKSMSVLPIDQMKGCDSNNLVNLPYGGWDHQSYKGFGGLVASAATMLQLLEHYYVQIGDKDIGEALTSRRTGYHGGTLAGTNTLVQQRDDGINVFIFFNKNDDADPGHYAVDFYGDDEEDDLKDIIDDLSDRDYSWPTKTVDGFWVDSEGTASSDYGSYDKPFAGMTEALNNLVDGSRVQLKPGSSSWTGTIATKLELRAPMGTVTIGKMP